MHALVALFLAISILELTIWFPALWDSRKLITWFVVSLLTPLSIGLLTIRPSLATLMIAFFSVYRVINLFRLIRNRVHIDHLYKSSNVSAMSLMGIQFIVITLLMLSDRYSISGAIWLYVVGVFQLVAAVIVISSTIRHLRTTKPIIITKSYSDKELPTVTVAIPARNETSNLSDCLNSLISSNYPKLEILVLDDCSQDRRTPEIIKDFALRGVRFIAGKIPPEKWLAKNYAYKQLVDESSGELIIFCGVDTRFEPSTIRSLVELSLIKNKQMISLIPTNNFSKISGLWQFLVQPSRYAWELTLPRRLLNRPAVLSTCWMIRRSLLLSSGGFEAVTNTISPESYFARRAISANDGYSFMQANSSIFLASVKSISDQKDTAIRTRYPQLHKRPEVAGIVTTVEFATLILPIFMVGIGIAVSNPAVIVIASISTCLQQYAYGRVIDLTYRKNIVSGYFALPLAALFDLYLLNVSMIRYEFGEVIWKDRNVCIPIMDVRNGATKNRSLI